METVEALTARLRSDPSDQQAYGALRVLYEQQGDYASLANLIAGWAGWVQDDREASAAFTQVGQLLAGPLVDPARAEEYFLEALRRDVENLEALDGVQGLWQAAGQYERIRELLHRQAQKLEQSGAPARTIALTRLRLGQLERKVLGDDVEALAAFRKAFELDPALVRAIYEARKICLESGELRGATELYEREISAEHDPSRRLALLVELSALYRDQLGDLDGAVSAMQRAHGLSPDDANLAYDLAATLVTRSEHSDERTAHGDRSRAADLLCGIAAALEPEQAVTYLSAALGYAPDHEATISALEQLLENGPRHIELAAFWVAHLAAVPDGRPSQRRRVKLARAYAAIGQLDDARYCLQPAVDAGVPAALELMEELGLPAEPASEQPLSEQPLSEQPPIEDDEVELLEPEPTPIPEARVHVPKARAPEPPPKRRASAGPPQPPPASTPAPSSQASAHSTVPPKTRRGASRPAEARSTLDIDEIKTAVAEPELMDELQKASAERSRSPAPPPPAPRKRAAPPAPPQSAPEQTDDAAFDATFEPAAQAVALQPELPIDEQRALRRQAGELAGQARNEEAAAAYARVLASDPSDREAFAFLDGYYRRTQAYAQRAELLEHNGTSDQVAPAARASRLREAASIYETRIKDFDRAARAMQRWVALEPNNDEAQRGLKRMLERSQRWDELAVLMEADVARAPDGEPRLALLRRLLTVHRDKRSDLEATADVLARILALRPDDRPTRDALLETQLELGNYEQAAGLFEQKIRDAATRPQRLALMHQLAELYRDRVHDNDRAFRAYERVLDLSPSDSDALDQMAQLDQSSGNLERLIATLDRQANRLDGGQAASVVAKMAQIAHRQLQDVERAAELWQRAIELAPDDPSYFQALIELYEESGRYPDLIELLRERAMAERAVPARIELLRRIAHVYADRMQDAEGAHDAWLDVLKLREDREALIALQHRALTRDEPEALVDVLRRLSAMSGVPEEKRDLLFDRALLLAERLGKPAEAADDLVRILSEIDPGFEPALHSLWTVSEASGNYQALARVLEQRLGREAVAEERISLARTLADLYLGKLADPEGAIRVLSAWTEVDPDNAEPQRRLRPLLAKTRRNAPLLATLDALSRIDPDLEERARAAIEAADLANKLRDPEGAWRRLLPLVERKNEVALDAIVQLARTGKRWDELYDLLERTEHIERLLELLRERVSKEKLDATRAPLLRRIAQTLIDYVQDEEGAAAAYRELLEIEEDIDALRFLQVQATRKDDPDTLVNVLARLGALEPNLGERHALLFERARLLHTRLSRPTEAVIALQAITEEDPDFDNAWDELLRACESAGDAKTLAATLERILVRTHDAESRIALATRLADLCEQVLRDAARAIAALQVWAEADPNDPEPFRRVRPLLQAAHRDRELLACLDALARTEPVPSARLEATLAAATVARNQLGDFEGAWQRLLPHLPNGNTQVDQALYALATETGRYEELYSVLEQSARYETLVTWLGQRVVHERDAGVRVELLRRMARTLDGPIDDPDRAEQAWTQLLTVAEDVEALQYIRAHALQHDDVVRLADTLRRLSLLEADVQERRDLMYEHGHLLRSRLNRASDAVAVLCEVLAIDPDFDPALDELIEAAGTAGDYATLVAAIERALLREPDAERRVELAGELAELCETRLNDPARAIAALRIWIDASPHDATPHVRIAKLLGDGAPPQALLAELDQVASKQTEGEGQLAAWLLAAEVALERCGDPEGAWQRVLPFLNRGHGEAEELASRIAFSGSKLDELIGVYEASERYDDLVLLLRQQAERSMDQQAKAELYTRCARLLAGPLHDEVAAVEAYREVLAVREDGEALAYLRTEALRMDDPEDLADLLGRLAAISTTPVEQRDLLLERALLLADRLDRAEEALALLRHILLELDPDCGVAIDELVALCEVRDDFAGLALGLERQLAHTRDPRTRIDTAARLATICEDKLQDKRRAIAALQNWSAAAPGDPTPLRRLRALLHEAGRSVELLNVLDALSSCEPSAEARAEAAVAAAELAVSEMQDAAGALQRLSAPFLARDERAEAAGRAIAEQAGLQRGLANLYVMRAQRTDKPNASSDWIEAARLFEGLNEPAEALEADLRALALDVHNRALLDAIDRLAVATQAFERLSRVYSHLVQQASSEEQCELLVRHAELLEKHARTPAPALDLLLQACRIDPENAALLDRADVLATALGSNTERAWLAELRVRASHDDESRARQLMKHAQIADSGLKDREQALRSIARALALTEEAPQVAAEIEDLVREMDRSRPELGRGDAMKALVRMHIELAQRLGEPFGPVLVLRAAQLLHSELKDEGASFDALKQGVTLFPEDLDLYDALERAAIQIKRLDALDAHLARAIKGTADNELRVALLRRRGKLLGEHLQRYGKAAEAYRDLLVIDPSDEQARSELPSMLHRDGRYQDLLRLYDEWLARTEDAARRVDLMRNKAKLWETDLRNRPGAIEVWREVLAISPNDTEASAMLARLQSP